MIVNAPKLPGFLGKIFGYSWNVSELTPDNNFHIRHGQLIDAIGFRHAYLQKHPSEKATVVVVTTATDHRVTQAVVAYTVGPRLHLESSAMGDITPSDLTAADIDRPEMIRKYIKDVRETYLLAYDTRNEGPPPHLTPSGAFIADAEERGDPYALVNLRLGFLYRGSSDDMLISALYWLNDSEKVGLVPVARSKVSLDFSRAETRVRNGVETSILDAVVFDYDGVHYLYNDQLGTLALPLPQNPVTGMPCLAVRKGDVLESLYFMATYTKEHPKESAALVPALDGVHAAAVFTRAGKLWMLSPFLGRFEPPARYRFDQIDSLSQLHEALVEREMKKLAPGTPTRPETGLPEAMPGDSSIEQVRRAYLAFKDLGLPVKLVENQKMMPGLQVNYRGAEYSYFAAE